MAAIGCGEDFLGGYPDPSPLIHYEPDITLAAPFLNVGVFTPGGGYVLDWN